MQKLLFGLWVKKFTFSILSSLKVFLTQLSYVATIVFRANTDNITKLETRTTEETTEETRKLEFEKWAKISHLGQNLILQQIASLEFTTLEVWT